MQTNSFKTYALALITGALLLVATMAMHPVGGDIHHILATSNLFIITHSLAIATIPILIYGFYGLTILMGFYRLLSTLGFLFFKFGMLGAMIAAALNGLVVPFFLSSIDAWNTETTYQAELILKYSFSFNKAMDYVLIVGCIISTLLWSVEILRSRRLARLLAIFGLLLVFTGIVALILEIAFTSLTGFRIFIFSWVVWVIFVAVNIYPQIKSATHGQDS